jgi:alkylation response protein AidB-like acyl-CoA dehydrogenase
MQSDPLDAVLARVRERAMDVDRSGNWPQADFEDLAAAGATRWILPTSAGGLGLSPLEIHLNYERVAAASLSLALILSQRDSAAALLIGSDNSPLRDELLPKFLEPRMFATIGIAQLTTSRQTGRPALRATPTQTGYQIDGEIPWSTGADQCDFVIAGAAIEAGGQILFALPTNLPGVQISPPLRLVALSATHTGPITCDNVQLDKRWIMRGPVEKAMSGGTKGLTLGQTFLAMGLCRSGLDLIAAHDSDRARSALERLDKQLAELRAEILDLCQPGKEADAATENARLRGACNELALRTTQTAIALYKGTALLEIHPAQRLAREAFFLLVWSCPNPVIDCTVDLLSRE